ncbi:MAG: sigma-70 family RNA polymerase sigma factor [Bacteroidota bacterium]
MIQSDTFFKKFIEDNKATIYKICRAYANDSEELKDFVQEVTIQLWRSHKKFENRSKVSTWVYRVTLNVCLTLSKKRSRTVDTVSLLSTDYYDSNDEVEREQVATLYRSIKRLRESERAIVLLYLDDKSYKEIAEILGITVTNVGARVNRVKNQLREIVSEGA